MTSIQIVPSDDPNRQPEDGSNFRLTPYEILDYCHWVRISGAAFAFTNAGVIVAPREFDATNKAHLKAFKYVLALYVQIAAALDLQHRWNDVSTQYRPSYYNDESIKAFYRYRREAMQFVGIPKNPLVDPLELIAEIDEQIEYYVNYTPPPKDESEFAPVKRVGYIYLLQAPSGYYKIGRTTNPDSRAKTFGIQLPFEVTFLHIIQSDDYIQAEKALHTKFADRRTNGEWFALSDDDVTYIKSIERM